MSTRNLETRLNRRRTMREEEEAWRAIWEAIARAKAKYPQQFLRRRHSIVHHLYSCSPITGYYYNADEDEYKPDTPPSCLYSPNIPSFSPIRAPPSQRYTPSSPPSYTNRSYEYYGSAPSPPYTPTSPGYTPQSPAYTPSRCQDDYDDYTPSRCQDDYDDYTPSSSQYSPSSPTPYNPLLRWGDDDYDDSGYYAPPDYSCPGGGSEHSAEEDDDICDTATSAEVPCKRSKRQETEVHHQEKRLCTVLHGS